MKVVFVSNLYPNSLDPSRGVDRLAREFHVTFVASVSGSATHIYLTFRRRARQILRMFDAAQAITTRSHELKSMLIAYGVPPHKIHVVYNGVDPSRLQTHP